MDFLKLLFGKFWVDLGCFYVDDDNPGGDDDPPVDDPVVDDDPPVVDDPPADDLPADEPPKMVPYDRLKEQSEQLQEVREKAEAAEKRALELERRISDNERKASRRTKEELEDWYNGDPVAAASALAEDKAYAIIDAQDFKNDTIEETADGQEDFKPFEREVKRKLRRIDFPTEESLRTRVELEFQAALGRKSRTEIAKAEDRGRNKAIKDKKVVTGSNKSVTPSKSSDNVQVTNEAKTFATGMGVTEKSLKDAAGRKDNVVE